MSDSDERGGGNVKSKRLNVGKELVKRLRNINKTLRSGRVRKPRPLPAGLCGGEGWLVCGRSYVDACVGLGTDVPTPRQYRRAAAWMRRVADWYDYLATKKEGGR